MADAGLYASLAAAQAEYPEVPKRRTATVRTKKDDRWVEYKYKYADLSDILSALRPVLAKHGLSILHRTDALDNGRVRLTGILAHASGQTVEAHMDLTAFPSEGKAVQTWGGNMTYARRYTLSALCGIATEDDDDANRTAAPDGYEIEEPAPRRSAPPPSRPRPVETPEAAVARADREAADRDPWKLSAANPDAVVDLMLIAIDSRPWPDVERAMAGYRQFVRDLAEADRKAVVDAYTARKEAVRAENLPMAG